MELWEVEWKDVWYQYEVNYMSELRSCVYVITVGVLIAEKEGSLFLAQDVYADGTFRSVTSIPHELIVRKKLVRKIKPKHKFDVAWKGMEEE